MTDLYLCEKPSQAKDIAQVLGANQRQNGYYEGQNVLVTWCFGHLLEMATPDDYDPSLKQWRLDSLPIVPDKWVWKVRKDAKKQYNIIVSLFSKVNRIVISTDADREGEAIAREVMEKGNWHGEVTRLWLSALDQVSIKKALDNTLPGKQTLPLYHAAVARSKADWLVGMSYSRLYTLLAQSSGIEGVMSVGRVQTPTLNLVVERDRLIEGFQPSPYFNVIADFSKEMVSFQGKWRPDEKSCDTEGRCISHSLAQSVTEQCLNQHARVRVAETRRIKEQAPLPYKLSALQKQASRLFGMGAQEVLDIAQSLYEKYKVTSYPRTNCTYLPESQFQEATIIIKSLGQQTLYSEITKQADAGIKSKCWNDTKISAHHAIIPTSVKIDTGRMSSKEKQIYDLICRRYLMQFYPPQESDQTHIELDVNSLIFVANGRVSRMPGWKVVENISQEKTAVEAELPALSKGDLFTVIKTEIEQKITRPPTYYTEGTLIDAMENIGNQVDDPVFKKLLKDTSGIGEEATRAAIIVTLLKRGFISKQGPKKNLKSSTNARALIDALPDPIKSPLMTAIWEQALDEIALGTRDTEQFIQDQIKTVTHLVKHVRQNMPESFKKVSKAKPAFLCPECEQPLFRRKANNGSGFFWGCSGYPECKTTLPDIKGKPGESRKNQKTTGKACPECGKGELIERLVKNGQHQGKKFLGCTQYPACQFSEFLSD